MDGTPDQPAQQDAPGWAVPADGGAVDGDGADGAPDPGSGPGAAAVPSPVRVALVDDHRMFLEGLVHSFAELVPALDVRYAGPEPADALSLADGLDVVVLDLMLGGGRTLQPEEVSAFVGRGVPVLVVSAMADPRILQDAVQAGALGAISKEAPTAVLHEALVGVATGHGWVSPELALAMLVPDRHSRRPDLSEQEQTALRLYGSGIKMATVARRMSVSEHTAKTYIHRVRAKYEALGRDAGTKVALHERAREDGFLRDDKGT